MQCKCGFETAPDAKFCGNCRSPLVAVAGNSSATDCTSAAPEELHGSSRLPVPPRRGKATSRSPSGTITAIAMIAVVAIGCWWLLSSDNGPSRVDQAVDRMYWVDGSLVVEPGRLNGKDVDRFTAHSGRGARQLAEGCYGEHFQLADGSVAYSLTDCEFNFETVYHWRPGHTPRELHRVTRGTKTGMIPPLRIHHLGASNRVLISEEGTDPLLFDAATGTIGTLMLASTEALKANKPDLFYTADAWTWFNDRGFDSDQQGTELVYTRCSGDDYIPTCGLFRQPIEPLGAPELLRAEPRGLIDPELRRGQYLFCSIGYEMREILVLDLSSRVWRQVVPFASGYAFSPDGTKLAVADSDANVSVLTYDDGTGTYKQRRRLTNFPTNELPGHRNLEWISDSLLAIWIESGGRAGGIWRADLDAGTLDRLSNGETATQDAFFGYVRKQKGQTKYRVRIPRTTLMSESTARLIAKIAVFTLGFIVLAAGMLVDKSLLRTAGVR